MPTEGGPMPKHLAKGAIAALLDQRYSDLNQAQTTLHNLRRGVHLAEVGTFNAFQADARKLQRLKRHFRRDWLGETDPPNAQTTGWWHDWKGDPERVLREALIRALEISLGVDHAGARRTDPSQQQRRRNSPLPIDSYWVCGLPKFEAYISWNPNHVTMVVVTPGFSLRRRAGRRPLLVQDFPDQSRNPRLGAKLAGERGMLFVGQNVQESSGPVAVMRPGVVINHMDDSRGGIGPPL